MNDVELLKEVSQWRQGAVDVSDRKLLAHLRRLKITSLSVPQAPIVGVRQGWGGWQYRLSPTLFWLALAAFMVALVMVCVVFAMNQGGTVVLRSERVLQPIETIVRPVYQSVTNVTNIVQEVSVLGGRECTQLKWKENGKGQERLNLLC